MAASRPTPAPGRGIGHPSTRSSFAVTIYDFPLCVSWVASLAEPWSKNYITTRPDYYNPVSYVSLSDNTCSSSSTLQLLEMHHPHSNTEPQLAAAMLMRESTVSASGCGGRMIC